MQGTRRFGPITRKGPAPTGGGAGPYAKITPLAATLSSRGRDIIFTYVYRLVLFVTDGSQPSQVTVIVTRELPCRNVTKAACAGPLPEFSSRQVSAAVDERISAVDGDGQVARIDPPSELKVRVTGSPVVAVGVVGVGPLLAGVREVPPPG